VLAASLRCDTRCQSQWPWPSQGSKVGEEQLQDMAETMTHVSTHTTTSEKTALAQVGPAPPGGGAPSEAPLRPAALLQPPATTKPLEAKGI